jgi:hypothetical protein
MRDLVRRWNAGELISRRQRWQSDNIREYVGLAAYVRTRISAAVEVDGSEISGDLLAAAVAFLRAQHQLRVSPFDLLRDSLLAAQISPVEVEDEAWSHREVARLATLRKRYDRPQRVHAWLNDARQTLPTDRVFGTGNEYASFSHICLRNAERAIRTGQVAPELIPPWTDWARGEVMQPPLIPLRSVAASSEVDRRERPEVPASSGPSGQLVDWYRQTFKLAVGYGLIDELWFSTRETWHAEAYRTFPGELAGYFEHIQAAERALAVEPEQRILDADGDLSEWYRGVFTFAAQLGLIGANEMENDAS